MGKYSVEDIKIILRALIISSPRGLTVELLDRDFNECEGTNIPFYNFGFTCLEDFLRSMPDTLLVKGTGRRASICGISSEKTKHIEKMVSKQKNIKSDRKILEVTPKNKTRESFVAPPNKFNGNVTPNNNINIPPSKLLNTPTVHYRHNANRILHNINQITSQNYSQRIDPNFNALLPTPQYINFYNYIPLMGNSVAPYNHYDKNFVNHPGNNFNNSTYHNSNSPQNFNKYNHTNPYSSLIPNCILPNAESKFNAPKVEPVAKVANGYNHPNGFPSLNSKCGLPHYEESKFNAPKVEPVAKVSNEYNHPNGYPSLNSKCGLPHYEESKFNAPKVEPVAKVANGYNHPNGYPSLNSKCGLPHYEESKFNAPKVEPVAKVSNEYNHPNGYPSLNSKCGLPHYEESQFNALKVEPVSKVSNERSLMHDINISAQRRNLFTNETSTANPIIHNNNQIPGSLLNKEAINYENSKKENRLSETLVNNSKFVNTHTNNVPLDIKNLDIPEPQSSSKFYQFINKSQNSSLIGKDLSPDDDINLQNSEKENELEKAVPELKEDDSIFKLDFPEGCASFGYKVKSKKLTKDILSEDWFGIYVTEVHSPYNFWFYFANDSTNLEQLMQELDDFYSNLPSDEYVFLKRYIKAGQICATTYQRDWHRAEILETPFNDRVKVFFMDYGTVAYVNVNQIKYLLIEFTKLERFANRAKLSDIKPRGENWTREATTSLLSMVSNLLLYARVMDLDLEEDALSLTLMDTNGPNEIQINNALVKKGHANVFRKVKSDNTLQEPVKKNSSRYFQGLFPTFDMLEKGHYPSFAEIGDLLKSGVDIDDIKQCNVLWNAEDEKLYELCKNLTNFSFDHEIDTTELIKTENIDSVEKTVNLNNSINPFLYDSDENTSNSSDKQSTIERNSIDYQENCNLFLNTFDIEGQSAFNEHLSTNSYMNLHSSLNDLNISENSYTLRKNMENYFF